jgi:hypothetical protein
MRWRALFWWARVVAVGGAICLTLGLGLLTAAFHLLSGFTNPAGTPLSWPPLVPVVGGLRHQPDLDPSGRFLALRTADDPFRVDVVDPVTVETYDLLVTDGRAAAPETPRTLGWDEEGRFWVSVDGYADGLFRRMAVFDDDNRRFRFARCADRPAPLLARAGGRASPRSDPLPPGAELPATHGIHTVCWKAPDGSSYALDVSEREYHTAIGVRFPVGDTRLLDSDGRFVAQLALTSPVGWAHDGSLLVYHLHDRDFFSDQWDVSRVVVDPA